MRTNNDLSKKMQKCRRSVKIIFFYWHLKHVVWSSFFSRINFKFRFNEWWDLTNHILFPSFAGKVFAKNVNAQRKLCHKNRGRDYYLDDKKWCRRWTHTHTHTRLQQNVIKLDLMHAILKDRRRYGANDISWKKEWEKNRIVYHSAALLIHRVENLPLHFFPPFHRTMCNK